MTLLYLVRHGETDWNREGRWQGHYDRPLSAAGRAQAAAAARRLARERISQIHASDLKRAAETAHIIGEACVVEVCVDRGLREVDVGSWAGLTHEEAKERFPEGYARRRAGGTGWVGGESYEQMAGRVRGYVGRLLDSARGSDRIALICHSGVIRVLVVHALGLTPSDRRSIGGSEHGALSVLRVRKGAWSLRVYNDACHLHAGDDPATLSEALKPDSAEHAALG
jgi:broad specificity phosphatase PhoE